VGVLIDASILIEVDRVPGVSVERWTA